MTEKKPIPFADLSMAPAPTERTIKMRFNLPYQATRFTAFSARMMMMVIKGH